MIRSFSLLLLLLAGSATSFGQLYRVDTLARAPLVQYPVTLSPVFDGSGTFFFAEKNSGRVRVYRNRLRPEPFVTLPVEDEGEQGLLGVAVHPAYPDTPFVYVYYTRKIDRSNVVERYRDSGGVGVSPELLLIVPREDEGTSNNGGVLRFGPDGCLYITVGDYGTRPAAAQDTLARRNYRGKILRINADGTIPADNPFAGKPLWAFGVRAGGGLSFDPADGALYCTDGGTRGRNIVARVRRGENLGWPGGRQTTTAVLAFPPSEQPGLTGVMVYRGKAFPRLRGQLLLAGNATPVLWSGTFNARQDSVSLSPLYRSSSGFADVQAAEDGSLLLTNGPLLGSRILRISPVAPAFVSLPPAAAEQGVPYTYTPQFTGTPPTLRLVTGPPSMVVDTLAWSLRWVPNAREAVAGVFRVVLRAENGRGAAEQEWNIRVANVNDPPAPFSLLEPADSSLVSAVAVDPVVSFAWAPSADPDSDRIRYHLQVDTAGTFDSAFLRDSLCGTSDTVRWTLPRSSQEYFWRVIADDGRLLTPSTPGRRRLSVSYVPPVVPQVQRAKIPERIPEETFPGTLAPVATLTYTIARAGMVRLTVFNLLGQEVVRVIDGVQPGGTHQVDIDKLRLPSGVYVYRLQAPGVFETKKMVIAR